LNQWIAAELSHPLKKIEMGLPKQNLEKIIIFPKNVSKFGCLTVAELLKLLL
jgi:hypothetical protein